MTKADARRRYKLRKEKRNKANPANKKRDESAVKPFLVYSQNVRGLCQSRKDFWIRPVKGELTLVKLDFIIDLMKQREIHIYLIQESWLENDWIRDYDSYTIFHHNVEHKSKRKTGVAIILSPLFTSYWNEAGGQKPITMNENDFNGRFIGIKASLPKINNHSKLDKKQPPQCIDSVNLSSLGQHAHRLQLHAK